MMLRWPSSADDTSTIEPGSRQRLDLRYRHLELGHACASTQLRLSDRPIPQPPSLSTLTSLILLKPLRYGLCRSGFPVEYVAHQGPRFMRIPRYVPNSRCRAGPRTVISITADSVYFQCPKAPVHSRVMGARMRKSTLGAARLRNRPTRHAGFSAVQV